ncbi:MAG: cytochrome c maturation protein CcmE [Actinomycetia bacterium]|nr:cytochrome c maturation protein CcmE [Actinomycetes bacterium]
MDLSPREVVATAPRGRKKPWFAYAVLALVLIAGGVVVAKFLTSALDYYCNVDEVGVKDGCDEGRNIRIQGTVEQGSVETNDATTNFIITFNGASMPVELGSEPTGLFQECIPVVVTGKVLRADDGTRYFAGEEVIVKHDNQYDAENEERLDEANAEAAACSRKG